MFYKLYTEMDINTELFDSVKSERNIANFVKMSSNLLILINGSDKFNKIIIKKNISRLQAQGST